MRVVAGTNAADVDEELAPLIEALWTLELDTVRSCQEHTPSGKVWIEFADAHHAEAFLDLVVAPNKRADAGLWHRAQAWGFGQLERGSVAHSDTLRTYHVVDGWEFHASVTDASHDHSAGRWAFPAHQRPVFLVSISVLFPRRDLPLVTERATDASKRRIETGGGPVPPALD